jgi:uncharacterized Zn finger protein
VYAVWLQGPDQPAECDCADWKRHGYGHACKHIIAAELEAQAQAEQPSRADAPVYIAPLQSLDEMLWGEAA